MGGALVLLGVAMAGWPTSFEPSGLVRLLGPLPSDAHLLLGILGGSLAGLGSVLVLNKPSTGDGTWNPLAIWCAVNALLGVAMMLLINTPVFSIWTAHVDASEAWLGALFQPIGAVIALHFALALPLARRGHHDRVALTVLVWFLVDTTRSALEGGWFNVLLPNALCLVGTLVAWWWSRANITR